MEINIKGIGDTTCVREKAFTYPTPLSEVKQMLA